MVLSEVCEVTPCQIPHLVTQVGTMQADASGAVAQAVVKRDIGADHSGQRKGRVGHET